MIVDGIFLHKVGNAFESVHLKKAQFKSLSKQMGHTGIYHFDV